MWKDGWDLRVGGGGVMRYVSYSLKPPACGSWSPQESQGIEGLLSHPKSIPSVIPNLSSHPTPHSGPRKDTRVMTRGCPGA